MKYSLCAVIEAWPYGTPNQSVATNCLLNVKYEIHHDEFHKQSNQHQQEQKQQQQHKQQQKQQQQEHKQQQQEVKIKTSRY